MDDRRFDTFTRTLADVTSRRILFKSMLAAVGSAALSSVRPGGVAACSPVGTACTKRTAADCCSGFCVNGVCGCPKGTVDCGGACVDTRSDARNCGACGQACPAGQTCQNGACACPSGTTLCGGACINTSSDAANCGGCGITCLASSPCKTATCSRGRCVESNLPNGTHCDDGNACTVGDTCQKGVCKPGRAKACVALDQCHVAGICDPATGLCSDPNAGDGTSCNDGNACTRIDTCQSGVCVGSGEVRCTALDQCHDAGTCDPATGQCSSPTLKPGYCTIGGACVAAGEPDPSDPCRVCDPASTTTDWSAAPDGTRCSDDNACTDTDTCRGGVCMPGTNVVCPPPPDDCHEAGVCNAETGQCEYAAKADGTACDAGNPCTVGDACVGGSCQAGSPKDCGDGNPCTTDACDPATGACAHAPVADGTPCDDDGDPCTIDACQAGVCAHSPRDCDDGDPCTVDACDPATGACTHQPLDCDDGNACTLDSCVGGQCVHDPVDCAGDDPCVTYGCDPEFGCTQEPTDCSDGDLCTTDYCDADGVCQHDPIECGNGPACSTASCDPDVGCVYSPMECPAGTQLNPATCACDPVCTGTQTLCGGACTDTQTDPGNCGACGHDCNANAGPNDAYDCVDGRCQLHHNICGAGGCYCPGSTQCCGPSSAGDCVNVTCCGTGSTCCAMTITAACCPAGTTCTSEGNAGNFARCV